MLATLIQVLAHIPAAPLLSQLHTNARGRAFNDNFGGTESQLSTWETQIEFHAPVLT